MPRPIVPPEINQPDRPAPLIVGRDPGSNESAQGRPFIGDAGHLLFGGYDTASRQYQQGSLAHAGLTRNDVNITNRVLRQPPQNDFYKHNWDDINDGKRQLLKLIRELKPSIIITTGSQAAYDLVPNWATLTDNHPGQYSGGRDIKAAKDILNRRGFLWYPGETGLPSPLLTTLHPASCLYQTMPNRLLLEIDMQRVGAVLQGKLPRRSWPKAKRIRCAADTEPLWTSKLVAYDIEIKWGGSEFLCIAFYTAEGEALLAYNDALGACEKWLRSDVPKLCHNGQFDRYFLAEKLGIVPAGHHDDTILAHWSCYPELAGKKDTGREDQRKKTTSEMTRKGLLFLNSFHLNVPWHKTYTSDPVRMGELCVNDVASTMWNWEVIEPELDSLGVRPQYERQVSKIPALIAVQRRGFLIDKHIRLERLALLNARQAQLEAQAKEVGGSLVRQLNLRTRPDSKEYIWYHAGRCSCCGGGSKIAAHCHRCVGLASTKKPELVRYALKVGLGYTQAKKTKVADLLALLAPCAVCQGTGKLDSWDFNPMSGTQMRELLDILEVPRYLGDDASEDTLRKTLEWAGDQ